MFLTYSDNCCWFTPFLCNIKILNVERLAYNFRNKKYTKNLELYYTIWTVQRKHTVSNSYDSSYFDTIL